MTFKNKKPIESRLYGSCKCACNTLTQNTSSVNYVSMEIIKYKISRYDNNDFSMVIYRTAEISFP